MRFAVLDALDDPRLADGVARALRGAALVSDEQLTRHRLRDERFAPCRGCFGCWIEHPGTCRTRDAANDVMRDMIGADVMVWVTRVRFGCWSPDAKMALDKSIGLLSPFFASIGGETHHRRRYDRYPRWIVLAVEHPGDDARTREDFRELVRRNTINLHGLAPVVRFVAADTDDLTIRELLSDAVEALAMNDDAEEQLAPPAPFVARRPLQPVPLPADRPPHVVFWIGSAKTERPSASAALAEAMRRRLAGMGWTAEVLRVINTVKLGRVAAPRLIDALRRADLIVPVCPVYVDCLPALVLAGLHHAAREDWSDRPRAMMPIVQCGFPELAHTVLALRVLEHAAASFDWRWSGYLAMGAGALFEGVGVADDAGGRAHHQIAALDAATRALHAGEPVPAAASEMFAQVPIGPKLYRSIGQAGWLASAIRHRALFKLWDQPFPELDP